MNNQDLILESLELCAETGVDITNPVYERFFELSDSGHELMHHSDDHMRGRMLEQVYELLFATDFDDPNSYLHWELDNHLVGYHATPEMYEAFFAALTEIVGKTIGEDVWHQKFAQAWSVPIEKILIEVNQFYQKL